MWFYYRNFLAFFRILTPLAIFPEIYDICSFQVKLQSIITPKNFVFLTCVTGSFSFFRKISFSEAPRFLKNIWWVFLIFSDNLPNCFHSGIKFVSSTNSMGKVCLHTVFESLRYIYIWNNNIPSIEPCGAPHLISSFKFLGLRIICNKLSSMSQVTFKPGVSTIHVCHNDTVSEAVYHGQQYRRLSRILKIYQPQFLCFPKHLPTYP